MIHKTRGIALNFTKFKESSIIVKIYTEKFGVQSYIVNYARTAKGKSKMALFQPLTLLDLVVYKHPTKEVNRISEAKLAVTFKSIPHDVKKMAISIFLTEVMIKCLYDSSDEQEFEFIYGFVQNLDAQLGKYENYHIHFLVEMSRYLGFDIMEIDHFNAKDDEAIELIKNIINNPEYSSSGAMRNKTLDYLLQHYHVHMNWSSGLKSLNVLKQVFE